MPEQQSVVILLSLLAKIKHAAVAFLKLRHEALECKLA